VVTFRASSPDDLRAGELYDQRPQAAALGNLGISLEERRLDAPRASSC
jgi:hypothetical protein